MQSDPSQVGLVTPTRWPDQPPNVMGVKTPTILCYSKSDSSLDSWGFTAMKKNTMKLHKIERIKLCLEPSTPEYLRPVLPKGLDADQVIVDYLRELHRIILETLEQTWGETAETLNSDAIMYCFTVPVNWSSTSHQRLRRAAFRAGYISSENSSLLIFCYEPEAASLACVHDPNVQLSPGSDFLVVDCGGGTVDLFQCRLGDSRELVELAMGQGGFFGAANVDVAFINYLGQLMTPLGLDNVVHSPRCATAWNNLLTQWESRKRSFTGKDDLIDEIFIPQVILKELEDTLDGEVPAALESGTIELSSELMASFFDPVVDSILQLIQAQIKSMLDAKSDSKVLYRHSMLSFGDPAFRGSRSSRPPSTLSSATGGAAVSHSIRSSEGLETLFVVGGFGNNQYLRSRITSDEFIQANVQCVRSLPNPEIAVLRGAVYATIGDGIQFRRARRSIGIQILRVYDASKDLESDVVYRDPENPNNASRWLVDTYVEAFLRRGDPVTLHAHYTKHHFALTPGARTADINLFASDTRKAMLHTRRDRCEFLGRVVIDAREAASSTKSLSISIFFGRIELEVCVTDTNTGQSWRTLLGHGHIQLE
jgi:hypothetical protein